NSDFITDTSSVLLSGMVTASHGGGQGTLGVWVSGGAYGTANGGKGTLFGTATITANGAWTFSFSSLPDGAYTIHITDGKGKGAPDLATHSLMIDNTAPTATAAESVSGWTTQTSDTITVSAADAGSGVKAVEIYDNGHDLGAATLANGKWSYTAAGLA